MSHEPSAPHPVRDLHAAMPLAAIFLLSAAATPAAAGPCTPVPHEECEGAIVFANADLPLSDSGILGCENNIPDKPYYDVFYRFDCSVTGQYTLDMCDSDGDTYIRIYADGCGFSEGSELAVADDSCPGSPPNADPLLTLPLDAGESYWIELGTWRPDPPWGAPNLPYLFNVLLECPGDLNDDTQINVLDLLLLLGNFGHTVPEDTTGDITGPSPGDPPDGTVDVFDLLALLGLFGQPCPG